MIQIITCECGSAEGLARKLLRGVTSDYLTYPVYKGKAKSRGVLDSLPDYVRETETIAKLYELLANKSKYVVVIGYDDHSVGWADVMHGTPKEFLDGQVILEKYM